MIAIVDYGSGNIQAIQNIFTKLKIETFFASTPEDLERADKIILPGVGAFDEAMTQLEKSGMRAALDHFAMVEKKPVLGICVGLQVMAKSSDEGELPGLGWFDASVKKFDESKINFKPKLPHMGWNEIEPTEAHPLLSNIDCEKGFYFIHSYYFEAHDEKDVLIKAHYGDDFCCAVRKDNIFGFQFHPEKSHSNGINLFKNFAEFSLC
ncbi:imidazole glycerol phosphate synthase subunit HisH [Pseudoalteromonas luteoviolacea]|jgi:glutamine amidotransferase|uniref:Imidazole glycerol phosphate synthase subunit HisH n=1 Tax=Pseudoalteromonas luteoviolacea S4060-1 TaxID=1365257 RepID=A0A162B918_9GAMM|nr:imidazole glycerol phosphate synthase subunit HisH [Pseudoalteromonas luteoviolacea]KZN29562.1 imidazole glycerol phosphate synthase [Pseudoalteromonas luteoviolacea S2607]KZN68493.1 imidazole glycerol phosphate synthase [Pseudoalteromonas luteoviolacea S4060-1]